MEINNEIWKELLKDRTTNKNIIWATESYKENNKNLNDEINIEDIGLIKTRLEKNNNEKTQRTKHKAEVFTPSWVCNEMNNNICDEWLGHKGVFNSSKEKTWETNNNKIQFNDNKTWQEFVQLKVLEITCGEAPFLVSRYDTTTGEWIEINSRIGALDRKLRVINENCSNEEDWFNWVIKAYKSTYGFEWQGDNLFIARRNLLLTFVDYYLNKYKQEPTLKQMREIVDIISWNIWQMDGLKYVIPNSCNDECLGCMKKKDKKHNGIYCKIKDWDNDKIIEFADLEQEEETK